MTQSKTNIFPQLPDSIDEWTAGEIHSFNDNESLYDYINGGAELFISYGYQSAVSRRYLSEGQPEVTVEIFDMGNSENAYGVFSHARDEEDYKYGQGSQYIKGVLFFWKNNYYVSIMSSEETDETKKLFSDLGAIISDSIEGEGTIPGITELLPAEGLDKAGILYFHHYIWLNSYYFIAEENIFLIDDNTDAVLAKYGLPEHRNYLLIVQYNDEATALKAYKNFQDSYLMKDSRTDIVLLEDETWIGSDLYSNTFIAVFNGDSEATVTRLLSGVKVNLQNAANKSDEIINP
jgi:hypothetical protein